MNLHHLAATLAVALLAASCTSGTEGIFASIEREQKIVSLGGLSKTATVTSMAEFGSKYFATGGKALFSRAVTGTTWDKGTIDGKTEVAAVGATSTAVWAVAGGTLYRSTDGTTWTAATIPSQPAGETPSNLIPVRRDDGVTSDELILVLETSAKLMNRVYRISGSAVTSTPIILGGGGSLSAHVNSAVYQDDISTTTTTAYYLASESYLWQVNATFNSFSVVTVTAGDPVSGYAGILYLDSNDTLYLGTKSNGGTGGGLYSVTNPNTTPNFTTLYTNVKVGTNPVTFGQFLFNTTNSELWVATGATIGQEGNGYMELTLPGVLSTTPQNTDSNNYTSTSLKTYYVGTLFKGSTGYFLGTVAHGLWTWNSSTKIWSQQ